MLLVLKEIEKPIPVAFKSMFVAIVIGFQGQSTHQTYASGILTLFTDVNFNNFSGVYTSI